MANRAALGERTPAMTEKAILIHQCVKTGHDDLTDPYYFPDNRAG